MFCSKCGNEIKEGDMFCEKCGAEVNNEKIVNENEQMQNKNYFNLDFSGMNLFGIASAIVAIISVFLPCISVTLFGTTLHINYIQGDGIFVLIISIIAVIAAMFNKNIILIILGILDFIIYAFLSSNLSTQYLNIMNKGIGYYLLPIGAILIVLSGIYSIYKKKHLINQNNDFENMVNNSEEVVNNLFDNGLKQAKNVFNNIKLSKKTIGIIGGIIVAIILLFFGISFIVGMKNPGKFVKDSNLNMQYKFKDGHFAKNEWVLHNNDYFYFNNKGIMQKNKWVDSFYYVDNDGKMKSSSFIEDDGNTYYLKKDGKYASNELLDIEGKTYAFDKKGVNIKNDTFKSATPSYTCYINNEGYIEKGKGLINVEGGTIYIEDEETGALKTDDWLKNENTGKYIYFDSAGWMVKAKKIIELETDGEIMYLVDNTANAFDGRSSKFILELYSNAKYYYVDENGEMVTNANKKINGVEWEFDGAGVGKELNWKISNYKNSSKKYTINKYYYVGQHISSLYDKGQVAYMELCIDNEDVALFLYEGENKKRVKSDYSYYDIYYNLTITSKSFQKGYKFTGTMFGKGDRVFIDNNSARTTIKNLLLTGENFLITIREENNYWDETYEFIVDAGNYADIHNKF